MGKRLAQIELEQKDIFSEGIQSKLVLLPEWSHQVGARGPISNSSLAAYSACLSALSLQGNKDVVLSDACSETSDLLDEDGHLVLLDGA